MDIDLAALPDDVEALQRMVRTLAAERTTALAEAQAEIERLRLIVQKLRRNQFGRRAERLDQDQLQLGFEDLGSDIARVEATLPQAPAKAAKTKSQFDRPSMPEHLPRVDMRLDVEHQGCPCCGGSLHLIGETVSEMLDHVPARLRVIRIRRPRYGCRACGTIHSLGWLITVTMALRIEDAVRNVVLALVARFGRSAVGSASVWFISGGFCLYATPATQERIILLRL